MFQAGRKGLLSPRIHSHADQFILRKAGHCDGSRMPRNHQATIKFDQCKSLLISLLDFLLDHVSRGYFLYALQLQSKLTFGF